MDQQRPLLYLTLVFFGYMIWAAWQQDHAPKVEPPAGNTTSGIPSASNPAIPASSNASTSDIPQSLDSGTTATAAPQSITTVAGTGSVITVKTSNLHLQINTLGGEVQQVDLPTYPVSLEKQDEPVVILDRKKQYSAQSGLKHKRVEGKKRPDLAPDHNAVYVSGSKEYVMKEGTDTLVVPLTWTGSNGISVDKRFIFKRDSFSVEVEHTINNASSAPWSGSEYRQIKRGPAEHMTGGIFGGVRAYIGPAFYDFEEGKYKYKKLKFGDFDDEDEKLNKNIKGSWIAMLQHYFISSWIPPQEQTNLFYNYANNTNSDNPNYTLGMITPAVTVTPGANHTFKSIFYVGPVIQEDLEKIANGLDRTVDYGIFSFVSKPIFWLLKQMYNIFGNWGWAIIFVTITIKIIFFYPSAMSYKSMAKMKKLAPKMKSMQDRYKNDPQAKQKAMMEFYKKEKINPLGGCLPMLIQIPVFMGLYWVLQESVELRQAPWLAWYKDLSIMDPFLVLPLLMGLSMWFQQKLNPPQMDPMQQKIFQWLPVVFTVMFLFFPAGLVLYWLVNNVLSIAQQWYINKKIVGDG